MQLVPIGTSKGVRIPKGYIEKYGFDRGIEIKEEKDGIRIIPAPQTARSKWSDFYEANASKIEPDYDFLDLDISSD